MHSNTSSRSKLSLKRKKPKDNFATSLSSSKAVPTSLNNLNVNAQNTSSQSQSNPKLQPHSSSELSLVITKIDLSQRNASRRPHISTECLSEGVRSEECNEVGSDTKLKYSTQLESGDGSQLVETNLAGMISAEADANKLECDEDDSDFKEPVPQMIKRKRKKKDLQDNYMQSIDDDQLQLALVLSASIDSHGPPYVGDTLPAPAEHAPKRPRKQAKPSKKEETVPPLLTVTSQQAREMLAQRAQEMLEGSAMDDDHIQSTPTFQSSKLLLPPEHTNEEQEFSKDVSGSKDDAELGESDDVMKVESVMHMSPDTAVRDKNKSFAANFQHLDYPTLWELTDFNKFENEDFYVPSLSSIITPVKTLPHTVATHPLTDCGSTPPTNTPSLQGHNEEQVVAVRHLCSDLKSLLGSSLFSDVEISTRGGTVISSHAVLLAARCPSLRVLLSGAKSRPIRLDWSDYEDSVVLSFLDFLYTGAPPPTQCDHAEMESLTALAREWSLGELEAWCAASMSSVIHSQFGTTSETNNSLVTKEMNAHSSATEEVVSKNEERVSKSPEIIDLSQSSSKSTNTNCTELADEPLLISESPTSVENKSPISLTSTTDFDLLLRHTLDSEVTTEKTENITSYSKTDIGKHSPSPCILLSSSDSIDPQKTELDEAIDPTIDREEGCNSDDLFSLSPLTTCNELTLSPPTKRVNDVITRHCFEGDQSIHAATEPIQQLEPPEPELYIFDNLLIGGSRDTDLLCEDYPTPTALYENNATSGLITPGDQLKPLTLGRENLGGTFRTPLGVGQFHLETDDDITPMPKYRTMVTPLLKVRCAKFGVKPLAKRKMIAKLEEIYDYAHPLVGEGGEIVAETRDPPTRSSTIGKKVKKTTTDPKENREDGVDLKSMVRASICSNEQLYQEILMYKPLELALIHSVVKDSGVSVSKEKLRDILDQWCVTFTIPRHADMQKADVIQA